MVILEQLLAGLTSEGQHPCNSPKEIAVAKFTEDINFGIYRFDAPV